MMLRQHAPLGVQLELEDQSRTTASPLDSQLPEDLPSHLLYAAVAAGEISPGEAAALSWVRFVVATIKQVVVDELRFHKHQTRFLTGSRRRAMLVLHFRTAVPTRSFSQCGCGNCLSVRRLNNSQQFVC